MLFWLFMTISISELILFRIVSESSNSLSALTRNAETIIQNGSLLPELFHNLELGAMINQGHQSVTLSYLIKRNHSFWITVTPCTDPMESIQFRSSKLVSSSRSPSLQRSGKMRHSKVMSNQFKVIPIGLPADLQNVKYGSKWLRGSKRSRMSFFCKWFPGDHLHVSIFGEPGAAFKVLLKTNFNPKFLLEDYPSLSSTSSHSFHSALSHPIQICRNTSIKAPHLDVSWPPVLNEHSAILYCVLVNPREDLPEQCSASIRIPASSSSLLHGLSAFTNSNSIRKSSPITNFVFQCTQATELRVNLPDQLAKSWATRLYVNIFAIDQQAKLSSGYSGRVLTSPPTPCRPPSAPQIVFLQPQLRHRTVQSAQPIVSTSSLFWDTDATMVPDRGELILFVMSCGHPINKKDSYRVQVYRRFHYPQKKQEFVYDEEICSQDVNWVNVPLSQSMMSPIIPICQLRESTDSIRIHTSPNSTSSFLSGQKIARLFLIKPKSLEALLPIVPGFSTIDGRQSGRSFDMATNYNFSGACQSHQVILNLAVSETLHYYWVYTIPLSITATDRNNATFMNDIQNKVNHCEFSNHPFHDILAKGANISINYFTTINKTQINYPLPVFDNGVTRFYLVLVYSARELKFDNNYQSLIVNHLVDACKVVNGDCYTFSQGQGCPH